MSAYAILGATGQVGGSILNLLGESPMARIHVLVRSRAKLEKSYPNLSTKPNISVFEGSISDAKVLTECLKGTKAAFLTVAATVPEPGITIANDTAHAVVSSLKLFHDANIKPPRLIVLSSASVDDKFWLDTPRFIHKFLYAANVSIYEDLKTAEKYLRSQQDWLSSVFVMPGGLVHDVQKGHELSTSRQQTFISFLDLAAGMIEAADEESGRWDMQNVSVVLKDGQKARFEWRVPIWLLMALLLHFFPFLKPWLV